MKKESDQPELPLAWPAPAFRSRSFRGSAESNMPMQRLRPGDEAVVAIDRERAVTNAANLTIRNCAAWNDALRAELMDQPPLAKLPKP